METRRGSSWVWVAGAVVLVAVLYVLSVGPACWISSRSGIGAGVVSFAYQPIIRFVMTGVLPMPIRDAFHWYVEFGAGDGWHWYGMPGSPGGDMERVGIAGRL